MAIASQNVIAGIHFQQLECARLQSEILGRDVCTQNDVLRNDIDGAVGRVDGRAGQGHIVEAPKSESRIAGCVGGRHHKKAAIEIYAINGRGVYAIECCVFQSRMDFERSVVGDGLASRDVHCAHLVPVGEMGRAARRLGCVQR